MSSYTPINLPYFAPAHVLPAPLPTLNQVLSSKDYLVSPVSSLYGKELCVVRIGEHFVAKYGKSVRSIEAENMLFVKEHTTIPIPQVYAIYTFAENTMIIMDFIKGNTLQDCMSTMNSQQLDAVRKQLKAQVDQLRRILAPDYYGSIGQRPLLDAFTGRKYGPFDNFTDMVSTSFDLAFGPRNAQRFADIKKFFSISLECVSTALGHAYPVFTHGDFHEENVIVQPNGTPCIIDYEVAGFYPSYHERLSAELLASRFGFLEEYPHELQIAADAQIAWNKASMEEPNSEAESESDSESEIDSD
ncbi:kinase-like domain-containing protein [Xylaria acuta]|nr:kinase-like domain-containing protein [Xylaria acuta]